MQDYDVIVVGGGSAGVAAAIGAANAGARVGLIEAGSCLGGASTLRGVSSYCGLHTLGKETRQVVAGVGGEVLDRLRSLRAVTDPLTHGGGVFVIFDPEAVKVTLDNMCADAKVDVLLHAFVSGAERDDDRVTSIEFVDHGGAHRLSAKACVDASGDGDLAVLAGASTRYGDHGAVNLGTMSTRFGGISRDVSISSEVFGAAVDAARKDGKAPLSKTQSIMLRLPFSGDLCCYLASVDYDPRDASSLSCAEAAGRKQAWNYLNILRTLPGCDRAYLVQSGPEFGTRESRHINAVQQLRWDDIVAGKPVPDGIALGAWGVEWHRRDDFGSSFTPPPRGAYSIPLTTLCSVDTHNLFAAGRIVDGDRQAGASVRVMATAFATGQAAGVAAAETARSGPVDYALAVTELRRQGALVDLAAISTLPLITPSVV